MYVVLTLCLLLFVYALYSWDKRNAYGHKLPPALPGGLPIIGHLHLVLYWARDLDSFMKTWIEFCFKSGGIISGSFLGRTYYGVTDFDDAVTIANAFSEKHHFYRFGEPWVGKGLISASGPIYHAHRKLLNPAYTLSVAHGYIDIFNHHSRRLTDILDGFVGQGPVNPSDAFKDITLRTSCVTTFGAHDEKDNDFVHKYILAMDTSIDLLRDRLVNPLLHNDFLYSLSTQKKKLDNNVNFINEIIEKAIQKKKEEMKNIVNVDVPESDTFRSFLDMVVELAAGGALTDKEIIDELHTFAVASYETTGQQLAYIAVLLGSYPDKQDKVYNEIMDVIGDRDLNKQDLSKLVYTEAFIKECMRLRTVVNILARYADRDLKLKNYTIRAGSYVITLVDGLHMDAGSWGSDVNEFRPERWLEKENQLKKVNFGFGYAQRMCMGKKYAMVSMKIAVAHVVRKFRLKGDFSKMKYKFDIVIRPKSGMEITLERRNTE